MINALYFRFIGKVQVPKMLEIANHFLQLIPLDHALLNIWQKDGREALLQKLNLNTQNWDLETEHWEEINKGLLHYWLPQTKKYTSNFQFYTLWEINFIYKAVSVGNIGFEGFYNEDTLIISYAISKPFRNHGIASEAVQLLCQWVQADPTIKNIRAYTLPQNMASQKVLLANGFTKIISNQAHKQCYELKL